MPAQSPTCIVIFEEAAADVRSFLREEIAFHIPPFSTSFGASIESSRESKEKKRKILLLIDLLSCLPFDHPLHYSPPPPNLINTIQSRTRVRISHNNPLDCVFHSFIELWCQGVVPSKPNPAVSHNENQQRVHRRRLISKVCTKYLLKSIMDRSGGV